MNKDISQYIKKQRSPQRQICQKLRKLILETFPDVEEEMKWGALVFSGGKFYIGALKDHVNIGFTISGLTKKEISLFEGSGKTMRHIKIFALKDIDKEKLVKLFKMVNRKSKCKSCG